MIAQVSAAIGIIYTLVSIILLCFVFIFILKARKILMEKKTNECLLKYQDYFMYIQTHLDSDDALMVPHSRIKRHERNVLQKKLVGLIERIKGSHREKLIKLCEDLGLVRLDLKRLHSPLPWIKLNAVYNLGDMRSGQAVPRLLKLLETSKYDPTVFIIARSVAKCSLNLVQLREMVLHLVRHRKGFHHLIVDIMKESELDCTPLLIEFLHEKDMDIIKIALAGLPASVVSSIVPALYRLLQSEDEEIRKKAVKLLCGSSRFVPSTYDAVVRDEEKSAEDDNLHELFRNDYYTQAV